MRTTFHVAVYRIILLLQDARESGFKEYKNDPVGNAPIGHLVFFENAANGFVGERQTTCTSELNSASA